MVLAGALVVVSAGAASAAISAAEAKRLDEVRRKGLSDAVAAHVRAIEPSPCAPDELREVTAVPIAGAGTIDYVGGGLDGAGKEIPRVYSEEYTGYFLVVDGCYSGSTKVGSWRDPKAGAIWSASYRQRPNRPRSRTPLTIARLRDAAVPSLDQLQP